jgi:hypothetical protein
MSARLGNKTAITHGGSDTRLYRIYNNMKNRCHNERSPRFADYGQRGISVCPQWKASFVSFRDWALQNGYDDTLVIDRIDNDGNYCPENCRWVTAYASNRNQRSNIVVEIGGVAKCLKDWSKDPICRANYSTITRRIRDLGWNPVKAITT